MTMQIACDGGSSVSDGTMDYVNADNIDSFRGCEIINGYLKFYYRTLDGSVIFSCFVCVCSCCLLYFRSLCILVCVCVCVVW